MKYNKKTKVDKYTLREQKRVRTEMSLKGEGEFLWINNTRGTLHLLKKPIKSPNPLRPFEIPPSGQFIGDSYFFNSQKIGEIRLVKVIKPLPINEGETNMNNQKKLILDQPDRFTTQGETEFVVPTNKQQPLNEDQPTQKLKDVLITEDPMDGVEIILS